MFSQFIFRKELTDNRELKPIFTFITLSLTALVNGAFSFLQMLFHLHLLSSQLFSNLQFFFMNIYVSNLSFSVTDDGLKQLFSTYGEVSSAKVIVDKFTNRSKGFGFVEMPDDAAGEKAIQELNGTEVEGRSLNVNPARPKKESW